jgi:hypothetical protein
MSYLLTVLALVPAGLALLDVLRLRTGRALPDAALAWLVGSGWLAAAATALRLAAGIPFGRPALLAVVLSPIALWGALRLRRARRGEGAAASGAPPPAAGSARPGPDAAARAPRWLPRPLWLFAPLAAYVVVVVVMVVLHSSNTPTQTDDGVRVRAFAPMLAFLDGWEPNALGIFVQAAPITTFVPAVAWILTGAVDLFHVNYAVLTELVACLALAIGLGAARGDPERGWAGAFALVSLPLFVYHCTSTYSDAVLALRVAGALLVAAEYARARDRDDLARAALLLGLAALVKREGELVAAAPAAVLAAQVGWERWRERRPVPWRAAALLLAPGVVAAIGKIAAVGLAQAFPMVGFVLNQAAVATGAAPAGGDQDAGITRLAAKLFFDDALFRSGNQGMLYWILGAVVIVRARDVVRRHDLAWPLLALAALFAEVAVNSVLLVPRFTVDNGTVNRALLVVSVPAALWVASAILDAVRAEAAVGVEPAAAPSAGAASGEAEREPTRRGRRRRSRQASRP